MNTLLDRLSIAAAVLIATAAVADLHPVARIVPRADRLEIIVGFAVDSDAAAAFAALLGALPVAHCSASTGGLAS